LMLWSGYLLRKGTSRKLFGLGLLVAGVFEFLVGVSYIPFYLGASTAGAVGAAYDLHVASSFAAFILAIILMIFTYRFTRGPFRYFSLALGLVALAAFGISLGGFSGFGNYLGLGVGGIERVLIYSFEAWGIGFGAYLLGGFGLD